MRAVRGGVFLGLMIVLAAVGGCSSEEHEQALAYDQAVAAGEKPAKDGFHCRLVFHTRSGDDKWERDKDLEFRIRKESEVRARASFENVRPGQTYAVHLVWIRPDGRELFRRYAEATVAAGDSGGYVADVVYKKADHLPVPEARPAAEQDAVVRRRVGLRHLPVQEPRDGGVPAAAVPRSAAAEGRDRHGRRLLSPTLPAESTGPATEVAGPASSHR